MRMNVTRRVIALYIHPDTGPVTPMELDLMQVELVALRAVGGSYDEARAREIARLVRAKFAQVDPESNWRELMAIGSRLSHADIFNGIVLRLPGTIVDGGRQQPDEETKKKLERLTRQFQQISESYQKERQELREKVSRLESEQKRLKAFSQNAGADLLTLRAQLQQERDAHKRARLVAEQAREETERLVREYAALQTQAELEREQQAVLQARIKHDQAELTKLRLLQRREGEQVRSLEAEKAALQQRQAELEQQLFSNVLLSEGSVSGTGEESEYL
jgi:DNA repair exonuclease SbcCD ATPase subunit